MRMRLLEIMAGRLTGEVENIMTKVKRYSIQTNHGFRGGLEVDEHADGDWVKWDELKPILEGLEERSRELAALEAAGVDNWVEYGEAFSDWSDDDE